MSPEFYVGLFILVAGTLAVAFPRDRSYVTRLINLEIPSWGLLLVMLSYDEALALFTFGGVSALTVFVFVRLIQKKEGV